MRTSVNLCGLLAGKDQVLGRALTSKNPVRDAMFIDDRPKIFDSSFRSEM
jgi:hypothetical protein